MRKMRKCFHLMSNFLDSKLTRIYQKIDRLEKVYFYFAPNWINIQFSFQWGKLTLILWLDSKSIYFHLQSKFSLFWKLLNVNILRCLSKHFSLFYFFVAFRSHQIRCYIELLETEARERRGCTWNLCKIFNSIVSLVLLLHVHDDKRLLE